MSTTGSQTARTAAIQFFSKHGVWSFIPELETPKQGRLRHARLLAEVERYARSLGYAFEWTPASSNGGKHCWSHEHWWCDMIDAHGKTVRSMRICQRSMEYRRATEAILALEESKSPLTVLSICRAGRN